MTVSSPYFSVLKEQNAFNTHTGLKTPLPLRVQFYARKPGIVNARAALILFFVIHPPDRFRKLPDIPDHALRFHGFALSLHRNRWLGNSLRPTPLSISA